MVDYRCGKARADVFILVFHAVSVGAFDICLPGFVYFIAVSVGSASRVLVVPRYGSIKRRKRGIIRSRNNRYRAVKDHSASFSVVLYDRLFNAKSSGLFHQLRTVLTASLRLHVDLVLVICWPGFGRKPPAWLFKALALPSPKPGRSRGSRPALA